MSNAHHLGKPLPHGIGTRAYWSKNPAGTVVVFVHGFRGKSLTTWSNFQYLLRDERSAKCQGADLVFYGYNGFRVRARTSATTFRKFIKHLVTKPLDIINGTLPADARRQMGFTYEKVLIVAHSLGAVVTRRAVLDSHLAGEDWVKRVQLAFFAPAHMGADIMELASEALLGVTGVGPLIGATVKYWGRVLGDLKPNSLMLQALHKDAQTAMANGPNSHLKAKVWTAEFDSVVEDVTFPIDDPPTEDSVFEGCRHTTLCKPTRAQRRALSELVQLL